MYKPTNVLAFLALAYLSRKDVIDNTKPFGVNASNDFPFKFSWVTRIWIIAAATEIWGLQERSRTSDMLCMVARCSALLVSRARNKRFMPRSTTQILALGTYSLIVRDLNLSKDTVVARQNQLVSFYCDCCETNRTGFHGTSSAQIDNSSATAALF